MGDFTETETTSWFSRLASSIKSVLIGLLLFVLSFPLLWWNEGRAVQTALSLDEGAGAVVSVNADKVDGAQEGKLVHTSGLADTKDILVDTDFGVSEKAIKLIRKVEMYQWVEKKSSKTKKKVGGSEKKKTTYKYKKEWSEKAHDSSDFKVSKGHHNPEMRFKGATKTAPDVRLGAFSLPPSLVASIGGEAPLKLDEKQLENATPAVKDLTRIKSGAFHYRPGAKGKKFDPGNKKIGDHRVRFAIVRAAEVSLVAKQVGNSFAGYQTKAGDKLSLLEMGRLSADAMFKSAHESNSQLTWILRLVGFLMMAIGVGMVFRPLRVAADIVPLFGSLLEVGIFFVVLAISIPLSLLTIAIAWIVARPLVGGLLLAGVIASIVGAVMIVKKKKSATAAAA